MCFSHPLIMWHIFTEVEHCELSNFLFPFSGAHIKNMAFGLENILTTENSSQQHHFKVNEAASIYRNLSVCMMQSDECVAGRHGGLIVHNS